MKLIGLSGYAHAGKSTAADFLQADGWTVMEPSAILRDMAITTNPVIGWDNGPVTSQMADLAWGFDAAKDRFPLYREFLQSLGTACRDAFGQDVLMAVLFNRMESRGSYVITSIRYPNEAAMIHANGGVIVRVHRPGFGPVNAHVSEVGLDNFSFDFTIWNESSITELGESIQSIAREIR